MQFSVSVDIVLILLLATFDLYGIVALLLVSFSVKHIKNDLQGKKRECHEYIRAVSLWTKRNCMKPALQRDHVQITKSKIMLLSSA